MCEVPGVLHFRDRSRKVRSLAEHSICRIYALYVNRGAIEACGAKEAQGTCAEIMALIVHNMPLIVLMAALPRTGPTALES